jgi:hypothetical protein
LNSHQVEQHEVSGEPVPLHRAGSGFWQYLTAPGIHTVFTAYQERTVKLCLERLIDVMVRSPECPEVNKTWGNSFLQLLGAMDGFPPHQPLTLWQTVQARALAAFLKNAELADDRPSGRSARIVRPPGYLLYRVAELVFSERTCQRIFEPILADLHFEYFRLLEAGHAWRARFAIVRGCYAFVRAFVSRTPLGEILRMALRVVGAVPKLGKPDD